MKNNQKERFPATDVQPGEHDDDVHVEHIEFQKQLEKDLLEIINDRFYIINEDFNLNDPINQELDSIDRIDLQVELERKYEISISDSLMESFVTYNDIILYLKHK